MASRIQEWAAEQWFNGPQGGTPITKDRLNRIEEQVEGITQDLNDMDLVPGIPATNDIQDIVKITQAAYDALDPKVATTLYVIVG